MARPSPEPRSPLVEKNGSRQRWRVSSVMPTPVSLTSSETPSDWPPERSLPVSGTRRARRVLIVMVPPFGMASSALKIRFVSISRSSDALPSTEGTGSSSARISIVRPRASASSLHLGRVRSMTCSTIWFSSTGWDESQTPKGLLRVLQLVGVIEEDVGIAGDGHQGVVEVMGDATRHLAERVQALLPADLLFRSPQLHRHGELTARAGEQADLVVLERVSLTDP